MSRGPEGRASRFCFHGRLEGSAAEDVCAWFEHSINLAHGATQAQAGRDALMAVWRHVSPVVDERP
jgi:hypothetical protein